MLKSQVLKVKFFMPFMEYIFSENQRLREVFFEESHRRINNKSDSFALVTILEIFLYNAGTEKLIHLFKGYEVKVFNLFYQLLKNIDPYTEFLPVYEVSSSFWPYGLAEKIGTVLSSVVKKKVTESIINEQFDELLFLSREQFLHSLSIVDFIRITLDPILDFINFIITKTTELENKNELYEYGIDLPCSDRNTQFISKKLIEILNEINDEKTDAVIGLCLHLYIHLRDFMLLPQEIRTHFFVIAHLNNRNYHNGERQNLDWQLGLLKNFESECITQHITDIIKKGVIKEIQSLFIEDWFSLLSTEDFIFLWDESEINLYKVILNINKDINRSMYGYGIHFGRDQMELLKGRISEKINSTITYGDEEEIRILFMLEFFDYLSEDEAIFFFEKLNFMDLFKKLDKHRWEPHEENEIHEFFKKYEPF
ncbi:MAG: hypothetical protein Lokiarch_44910 [Candidatus Lokiarchaeum sp. GC14_75]|nr:MAG: hypothetical protein Lokiarch_44910 [Candidatus Lokiarchaeum sp. GC14_75]